MKTELIKLTGEDERLLNLKPLYLASFPEYEAKPYSMIVDGVKNDAMDAFVLMVEVDGKQVPAGLAFVILADQIRLLDYLAIEPKFQSMGLGGIILKELSDLYSHPLVVEIESTLNGEDQPDHEQHVRRKAFYLKNGFMDDKAPILLFGVEMELMSTKPVSYQDYFKALDDYLSVYGISAMENIRPLEFPKNVDKQDSSF